jgi:hypothetical protein
MSDDTPNDDIRKFWQNQSMEESMATLQDIKKKVGSYQRRILWSNSIETVAGAVVIFAFGRYAINFEGALFRVGCGLIIAATLFVIYYLRKHGRTETPPTDGTLFEFIEFQLQALRRRLTLFKSMLWWYMAPFVPGLIFFLAGATQNDFLDEGPPLGVRISVMCIVFVLSWLYSKWMARSLQKRISGLELQKTA